MNELTHAALMPWQGFHFLVGSSAAALIGVQFVVITLIASQRRPPTTDAIHAFATPTVVHLASVLVVSALLHVPWPSLGLAGGTLAALGLAGLGYAAAVVLRARRQRDYRPDRTDWLWYTVLPGAAYLLLLAAGILLPAATTWALGGVATASLALLLIGIHNAWDTVTHIVAMRMPEETEPGGGP